MKITVQTHEIHEYTMPSMKTSQTFQKKKKTQRKI